MGAVRARLVCVVGLGMICFSDGYSNTVEGQIPLSFVQLDPSRHLSTAC